jgi:IMP dehydrogenase
MDKNVSDALELMAKYHISGIPIIDDNRKLIGIVTNRDLRFKPDPKEKLEDIMTRNNLITVPMGTTLEEAEKLLQDHRIEKLPVVDDNYTLQGLITFKDIQKKKKHPDACKDDNGRLRTAAAVGVAPDTLERIAELEKAGVDAIFVDTAHGHSRGVIEMVRKIKSRFSIPLVAGNIATKKQRKCLSMQALTGLKSELARGRSVQRG